LIISCVELQTASSPKRFRIDLIANASSNSEFDESLFLVFLALRNTWLGEQKVFIEMQILNRGKHGHAEEKTGKEEGKNDLSAANRTSARTARKPSAA
jgi:hypothetical protein